MKIQASQNSNYSYSLIGLVSAVILQYTSLFIIDSKTDFLTTLWFSHLFTISCIIALFSLLDLRLQQFLSLSDTPLSLDGSGIEILNEQANLGIKLIAKQDYLPQMIEFESFPVDQRQLAEEILEAPHHYTQYLTGDLKEPNQDDILDIGEYLEAQILPHLPFLSDRPQLGIFAKKDIPKGAIFLWKSDFAFSSVDPQNRQQLPEEEFINQRPLVRTPKFEVIQSGGRLLRSNPITLVNFAWCHTDNMTASSSPYRLLPPHHLGNPNCYFTSIHVPPSHQISTSNKTKIALTSAIQTYKAMNAGEQLLAFSGQGSNARVVSLRRGIVKFFELVTPALIIWPWLRVIFFYYS